MIPSTTTAEEKTRLRKLIGSRLTAMSHDARKAEDDVLFASFLSLPEVAQAATIALFCGVGSEPDTSALFDPLLARGKRLVLPRMLPGRQMEMRQFVPHRPLVPHPFGIPEPDADCPLILPGQIDLVLVPALCYDRQGYRLGMGGGYYDRWLAGFGGYTVGLCRQALLQDRLPVEEHDRPVDVVITPELTLQIK